jgi:hypothetical protein
VEIQEEYVLEQPLTQALSLVDKSTPERTSCGDEVQPPRRMPKDSRII